jgi:hypothetical protein
MIIIGYGSISSSTYYLLLPTTSTYYWSTFIKTQFFGFFIFFSKKTLIFNNFYVLEKKFVKFYFLEKNCPQKWGRLILPPHEIADWLSCMNHTIVFMTCTISTKVDFKMI